MPVIRFNRDDAAKWLHEYAPGDNFPRVQHYCDAARRQGLDMVAVDETQLGALVDDYCNGPGFGDGFRLVAWVDNPESDEDPGVRVDLELPVPGDEGHPLRIAGMWQEMRAWVDSDAATDEAVMVLNLVEYLANVATDAGATLTVARNAVRAGVLSDG